jgi:Domain of unknown function (DUF4136)
MKRTFLLLCLVTLAVGSLAARGMKITVHYDEKYDFKTVRSWTWANPAPGRVILLRSSSDNPEPLRQRFEPTVVDAVGAELQRLGLSRAEAAPSDVTVSYYLIVSVGAQTEYIGQNIPGSVSWVLPPMNPSTSRFEVVQNGSVVVDMISPAKQSVIWRGMAEAKIDDGRTDDQRKDRIKEAVKKVMDKYPPKPK